MSFAKEALKRYILLNLIEGEALANNSKIMDDISRNAIKAAETMKEIDDMFWSKKKENLPMDSYPVAENPYNNKQYYPTGTMAGPPQPQQPQPQQPQFSYPIFPSNREAEERQQRVANYQLLVQNLYTQINSLQTQLFEGVQKIHQQIGEISKNIYNQ